MPEYTLTPIPDMVLYVDGVPAIVPASNDHLKDATGWRDVVEAELL